MNKKIIGILVVMLMITTAFPVLGIMNDKHNESNLEQNELTEIEDETYIDPDILLTKKHLPLLKYIVGKCNHEKSDMLLTKIIDRIEQNGIVYSNDVKDIVKELDIGNIGIHFLNSMNGGPIRSGLFSGFLCFPGRILSVLFDSYYNGPSFFIFMPSGYITIHTEQSYYDATILVIGFWGIVDFFNMPPQEEWHYYFDGLGLLSIIFPH